MRVRGLGGLTVLADIPVSAVDVEEYAALVVPGGTPEILIDREDVSELVRRFHGAGKTVAAICVAPVHLVRAGVLAGRSFTTGAGQNWWDVFDWSRKVDQPVVIDGNIVTAQGRAFIEFALALMERLGGYPDERHARLWREEMNAPEPGMDGQASRVV